MADDFETWKDGEPLIGPAGDGSFDDWYDGQLIYAVTTDLPYLPIQDGFHLIVDTGCAAIIYAYTDFSHNTIGAYPTDWTNRWATLAKTTDYAQVAVGGAYGGRHLTTYETGATDWYGNSFINAASDGEVLVRCSPSSSIPAYRLAIVARGSGVDEDEYGYFCYFQSGTLGFKRLHGGSIYAIGSVATGLRWSETEWYWIRFRIEVMI